MNVLNTPAGIAGSDEARAYLPDWPRTCLFWVVFISILVAFDLAQRVAIRVSRRAHEKVVVLLNRCLIWSLRIAGTRCVFASEVELPADRPVIVVSNHQSMFDIPILHCVFAAKFPRFVSKIELSRWIPSVSYNLRYGGNAIIDRGNPRQAVLELKRLGARMAEQRFATVIFPEGTRARDGDLKKFRTAGLATLLQLVPDAVVVPVAIDGSCKITQFGGFPIPRDVSVKVAVGRPLDASIHTADAVAEQSHAWVARKLEESRAGSSV